MKKNNYKILNLYACLGGNRYKWDEVTDVEVTAVELDPAAAELYQERFPNEEIILLKNVSNGQTPRFKGKFVVENVIPYYEPLIPAHKRHRHLYWTNFNLPNILTTRKVLIGESKKNVISNELNNLCEFHDYDFNKYKGKQSKTKMARNLVDYEAGKTILETALNIQRANNTEQLTIL